MKNKILAIAITFCTLLYGESFAQKKKTDAIVTLKNGTVIQGTSKQFFFPSNFGKVSPFDFWLSIFKKSYSSPLKQSQLLAQKNIKFKEIGQNKFQKIPFDSINTIKLTSTSTVRGGEESRSTIVYKAINSKQMYDISDKRRNRKKPERSFLPIIRHGNDVSIYGEILPLRSLIVLRPFFLVFETRTPDAYGYHLIENSEKKIIISTDKIVEERFLTKKEVEKRAKSNYNRNHSSLDSLFGHCPDAKVLIDKYNVVRNNTKAERRKLSKEHNKKYVQNTKNFRKLVSKNRKNATNELYTAMFLEELSEIIKVYRDNCGEINDVYNPKSENFQKNIDILNDTLDYNKI